jgi:EmrB/QacA subfamily drug resistance transporter
VVLDTTIVNIALPRIITVFGSTVDQAQLVLTGYMLALAVVMPTTAYLSQMVGTRRLYLFTLLMFTLGSMLCGAAWSIPSLVGARVLQGLGGGMIQPLGMAMLFRVAPPHERGKLMGIYALPVMVAPIAGPTIGGYLVEYVDWRWVFYLNVPAGALGILLGFLLLHETPTRRGQRFDWLGFVLAALCTSAALLAATDAPDKGWGDSSVVLKLVVSAVALPIFIWWELRVAEPLVNLRLFAIPGFTLAALVNLVTMVALFGALFLLPVFLQNLRGLGAMETGLLLLPQAVASAAALVIGGRLYDRFGPRLPVLTGLAGLAVATWLLAKLDLNTPDSSIRLILILRGAAIGTAMMPAITAWMASAPPSQTQAASALNNVLRQLYGAFGTAAFSTILNDRITFHFTSLAMFMSPDRPAVARALAEASAFALSRNIDLAQAKALVVARLAGQARMAAAVRGFDDVFLLAAAVCVLGILPALFLRRSAIKAPGGPVEA